MFRRGTKLKKRSSSKGPAVQVSSSDPTPPIHASMPTSPTLPELNSTPVKWPNNFELVHPPPMPNLSRSGSQASHISRARSAHESSAYPQSQLPGANGTVGSYPNSDGKLSGHGSEMPAMPSFHRPFRGDASVGAPISNIYTARGSAFDHPFVVPSPPSIPPPASASTSATTSNATATARSARAASRRARKPKQVTPTFNLMVCGGSGSGKTSFLRLLLSSSEVSPTASVDQRAALARFLSTNAARSIPTTALATAVVELAESPSERLLLSVIDTPGFDFRDNKELALERQVSSVLKYVNDLYAETMDEEAKLVRENKGDQHIHLCIYLIDPSSFIPMQKQPEPPLTPDTPDTPSVNPLLDLAQSFDDDAVTLLPAELRVIKRLATRMNVLPVIAKSDVHTDAALAAAKAAVRRGLSEIGLDAGAFGASGSDEEDGSSDSDSNDVGAKAGGNRGAGLGLRLPPLPPKSRLRSHSSSQTMGNRGHGNSTGNGNAKAAVNNDDGADPDPDPDSPATTRGRRRRTTVQEPKSTIETNKNSTNDDGSESDNSNSDKKKVVKLRHSRSFGSGLRRARSLSRLRGEMDATGDGEDGPELDSVAVVRFGASSSSSSSKRQQRQLGNTMPFALVAPQPGAGRNISELTDSHPSSSTHTYGSGAAPLPLRGVFVRRFRWGTLDALNPAHSDFPMLRNAVLGSHTAKLRTRTREVLYEAYRTEKLLARRMTRGLSREEANRLLEELGLMQSPTSDLGSRVSSIMDG